MEVEVKTLSLKPNEKRGQVKLKMYRPNKLRKKDCSIQVMRSSGHNIVFVKAIMKHFIQPIIDAIIDEPDNDPLTRYTLKTQDKTMGKDSVSVHPEEKDKTAYCEYCDKMFFFNHKGLKIHMGKIYSETRFLLILLF